MEELHEKLKGLTYYRTNYRNFSKLIYGDGDRAGLVVGNLGLDVTSGEFAKFICDAVNEKCERMNADIK